jgi:HAMP domain-containing protein
MSLQPGSEGTPEYLALVNFLITLRSQSPELKNFYIMKKEESKIIFLIDDIYFSTPDKYAKIGEEYTDYEPLLLDAFDGDAVASEDFYTDEWGTFLSGYAPIKDSNGQIIAVIGLDMDIKTVLDKQNFLNSLVYYVILIAILFSGALVFYFSTTITKPVIKLKDAADKVTSGEDAELPSANRNDEVAELTSSMEMLIAAFKFAKQGPKGGKK